ncbi:MAG: hypothetical protein SFX18_10075 [Pirellulales bacterium]|nr:hypothetical protein [Pirellulales bacterium]
MLPAAEINNQTIDYYRAKVNQAKSSLPDYEINYIFLKLMLQDISSAVTEAHIHQCIDMLMELKSPIAIDLCVKHLLDKPAFSGKFIFVFANNPPTTYNKLCDYLLTTNEEGLHKLIDYISKNELPAKAREKYIYYAACCLVHSQDKKPLQIQAYLQYLYSRYEEKLIDDIGNAIQKVKIESPSGRGR